MGIDSPTNVTDDLRAENGRLREEIAALRAGEDDTPVPEGAFATPEQMLYRVNRLTRAERQQWIRGVAEAQAREHRCFVMDHIGKIETLKTQRDHALDQVRDLSARPTRHAYEAACEALEKRRVALVNALGLSDEGFYEAIEQIASLRGKSATVPNHPYRAREACGECGQERSAHSGEVLTVSWATDAIREAVDRAKAIVGVDGSDPDDVYRVNGKPIRWMDLACLVDAGRAVLADDPKEA